MSIQRKKMYGLTKANELYVNVGMGITGRGELVPLGCSETK